LLMFMLSADELPGKKTSKQTRLRRTLSAVDMNVLAQLVAGNLEARLREAIGRCLTVSLS
jgi:hypothetical protein